ncbi:MAG TPA: DUF748 domain-containing protein [Candidatus Omnitrophota bacterium]|nr:DUF748 domain-containing protein [Candidatus Omnitrophota bacterium]
MKVVLKIFGILCIVMVVAFIGLAVWVKFSGKGFLEKQITDACKTQTTIQKVSLSFPLRVTLEGLRFGDLAYAEKISCSPNIVALLAGKIVIDGLAVVNPVITLRQSQDGSLNIPVFDQKGTPPPQVFVNGLMVKQGKFTFTDYKIDPAGFMITADTIKADISRISFPFTQLKTDFSASADLFGKSNEKIGSFDAQGWFNLLSKDLDATIRCQEVQVAYFAPYYGDFLSKKKLTSVTLNLTNKLTAVKNELTVVSDLKLFNFVYAQTESTETTSGVGQLPAFTDALDLFRDDKGDLSLQFVINTKLDNPALNAEQLKKTVLTAAMKNLKNQSPEHIIQKVIDTVSKFKSFGEGMKKMFEENQDEQKSSDSNAGQGVGNETK